MGNKCVVLELESISSADGKKIVSHIFMFEFDYFLAEVLGITGSDNGLYVYSIQSIADRERLQQQ